MSVFLMLSWIAGLGAVLWGLVYGALLWIRKRAQTDALREVNQQFAGVPIVALASDAFFGGLDRRWDSRWRGCGVLILTRELLYFRSWQRNLDLTIPLDCMQKVEVSLNGEQKGKHQTYFQVSYQGRDDQVRIAIWRVNEPQQWVDLVHAML